MPIVIFKKKCLGYKAGQRVNLNPTLYEVLTAKGYVEDPQPEPAEIHDKVMRPKRKKK